MAETYIKKSGSWGTPVTDIYRKVSGVWVPSTELYWKVAGVQTLVFSAEIVAILSVNVNSFTVDQMFSPSDWTSSKNKRLIISPGVSVVANTSFAIATQSSVLTTGWGGVLTLENHGAILGMGGAANSGVGGNAMFPGPYSYSAKKLVIQNYGYIWSGGGGGGKGGNGGPGYFNYTATDGPAYSRPAAPQYWYSRGGPSGGFATWAGVSLGGGHGDNGFTQGIYFYYPVSEQEDGATSFYSIARQYTAQQGTSGGAGGNGGRGQGSDGTNAAGSAGAGGGTNAGTGGTGGTGGGYGSNGNTGNTGGSGNNGAGSAGTAGGLAGVAYSPSWYTLSNIGGDIRGRIV